MSTGGRRPPQRGLKPEAVGSARLRDGRRMTDQRRTSNVALLVLGLVHLVYFCATQVGETAGIKGLVYPAGGPVGGDFINMWTAARLVVLDRIPEIYRVDDFMAYQLTLTGGVPIALRMWVYPPHSLLLAWPLGYLGYYSALAVWSVVGLAVLFWGARRFGFDRLETAVILTSPATVLNVYHGQTGSLAVGLLLLALSARQRVDPTSVVAAALLTVKPQAGFMLPVIWAFQRRWRLIAWTALAAAALLAAALALFGIGPWRDYLFDTLPTLSLLERHGTGAFMNMIPSTFMSFRILTDDPDLAIGIHMGVAIAVGAVLLARLRSVRDETRRSALVMIAMVLMTPYLHSYDLALLLCGALLVARRAETAVVGPRAVDALVLIAWALPQIVMLMNATGAPLSPLFILPLLFLA